MRPRLSYSSSYLLRKILPNNSLCYCSSSLSVSTPNAKIRYSNTCVPDTHFSKKEPEFSSKIVALDNLNQNFSKPTSDNPNLTHSRVVESLLSLRNEPDSALEYYNWAQKQRGYLQGTAEPLCVLLQILAGFPTYRSVVRKLLDNYVSSDSSTVGLLLYHDLIKCSENFDFGFNSWILNALLTSYARAGRCSEAIDCFSVMFTRDIMPTVDAINAVLRTLINKNMILEGKKLYDDIVSKGGIKHDSETVHMIMRASLKEGKVDDAENYFVDAKARGIVLDTVSYCAAIRIACDRLDSEGAYKLLCEMKILGCTPFQGTFTNVICTCVKQRNMIIALRTMEEMMNCGHSMNIAVTTSLMKGYILQGDLSSALDLFDKIGDYGLCPDKVTYSVLIEGCCSHGNMEKALELNNLMKLSGIKSNVHNINSLIRGFFRARMPDEAIKQLNDAVRDGIANVFTYNNVLGWLCKEGRADEAHIIWEKMAEKGVELSVASCDHTKLVHCKKGSKVGGMSEVKDTMKPMAMGFSSECMPSTSSIAGFMKKGTTCPKSFCEWLAGIIDGDGNIQVSKEGYTSLEITVGLEDLRLLRYIQHMLGGGIKMRAGAKAYRYRLHNRLDKRKEKVEAHIYTISRLLVMRTWSNKLEVTYILTLWIMIWFTVFGFRNRCLLASSRRKGNLFHAPSHRVLQA